ncbi:sensor histidine kinase [Paenibacillus sp. EC2-1]|uniref:sensor histidine kinase n=1 Tax=Paenibacillus sp. EC2-1 TaxID=3388665 RepID=UPI003BEF48D6
MPHSLASLRFGLILIPAAIGLYVDGIDHYDWYTVFILLFLALAVLGRFIKSSPVIILGVIVELIIAGWLCQHYGMLMIFVSMSTALIYLFLSHPFLRYVLLGIHLIILNVSLQGHEIVWVISANLLLIMVTVFIGVLHNTSGSKEDTLRLYDELRRKHFELEEARSRMQQFAHQIEAAAQADERNRISHQLHDDIGHRLIRVKMMMEAAIYTVPQDVNRGMELLHQIRDQLGSSMDEMRSAVKRMNPGRQLADAYALDRLLEETGRETGIITRLRTKGLPYPLYPSQQVVLYKNAREAITNAIRHGHADQVEVLLTYDDHEVCMEVSNNGEVAVEAHTAGNMPGIGKQGLGLSGMLERTKVIGGTLEVCRQMPFTVITRLPVYRKSEII